MAEGLVQILEGALLAAGEPLSVQRMALLFEENERPSTDEIRAAIKTVGERCDDRGYELVQVASGFRFQVRQSLSTWVGRLWQERPARYSRALMETLSLIAYRQPITRGEIEEIRGVAVSTNIIKTLMEREWVRVVGHRDVPGRPAMYATTRQFLDYFNLKSLDQLPPLAEIKELDNLSGELALEMAEVVQPVSAEASSEHKEADSLEEEARGRSEEDTETP
jgi:segregation and condensation protein B